jgi:hypothetical protein
MPVVTKAKSPLRCTTMFTTALASTAMLVSLAFAGCTFERWLAKRRPYELTWTLAMLTFSVGAWSLAWGSSAGWNSANFRMFYVFGAIVNVPLLAVGQVELLSERRWVRFLRPAVLLAGMFAIGVLAVSPLRAAIPAERLPQGKDVFGVLPRVLAAVASAGGAVVVFAGAAYSTVSLIRARSQPPNRVLGTGLITLGTVVLSVSGTLQKRFGEMTAFAITLTLGVIILFAGFLVATVPRNRSRTRREDHRLAKSVLDE